MMTDVFSADSRAGERVDGCDRLYVSWSCGKVIDTATVERRETASNDVQRMVTIDRLAWGDPPKRGGNSASEEPWMQKLRDQVC